MEQLTYILLATVVSVVYNATLHLDPKVVARRSAVHFLWFLIALVATGWLLYPLTY